MSACRWKGAIPPGTSYFPLSPDSVWTYQIMSRSQATIFQVTDRVVGIKYVPALKVTGSVVDESYSLSRGGTRPLIYYAKNGYLARLSALGYDEEKIEAPAWGRSEEAQFLPIALVPHLKWSNVIFPYGHMAGSFDVNQTHRTFYEPKVISVPAGNFSSCIRIETDAIYEGGNYSGSNRPPKLCYMDWYAPNVGLVRTVALEANGSELERVELIHYKVQQPKQAGN